LSEAPSGLLPPDTRILVLSCGKAGHDVNSLGIAAALGGDVVVMRIEPHPLFAFIAPWGPPDPSEMLDYNWPDIIIASGRVTAPVLRVMGAKSKGHAFTLYLQDPRAWRSRFDMIWMPEHDQATGPNILKTLTSPHGLRPNDLARARERPDPRIASLQGPRLAIGLGGPSSAYTFTPADHEALVDIARSGAQAGFSLMITPSRRTPPGLMQALRQALIDLPPERCFIWNGSGENPYVAMLANADCIVVTADSVNMVGEAAATGAPVYLYEPGGGSPKITRFLNAMIASGAVRRFAGAFERWTYQSIDATHEIASEVARRYMARKASLPPKARRAE
jgi:mitochondrial fission protein ELM1